MIEGDQSLWFALDYLGFGTESAASQETPQSWTNWGGQSRYNEKVS